MAKVPAPEVVDDPPDVIPDDDLRQLLGHAQAHRFCGPALTAYGEVSHQMGRTQIWRAATLALTSHSYWALRRALWWRYATWPALTTETQAGADAGTGLNYPGIGS